MCGRFIEPELIGTDQEHSETKINPFPGQPVIIPPRGPRRYNVAPTQDILILGKSPLVAMTARWWFVPFRDCACLAFLSVSARFIHLILPRCLRHYWHGVLVLDLFCL